MPSLDGTPVPDGLDLSVVVPVFNEEPFLETHLRLLTDWLEGLTERWELILVNDGSMDGSPEIIQDWAGRGEHIHGEHLPRNRGRGAALRTGMRRARGTVVVTTEADLSWSFACLAQLAWLVGEDQADVAVASPHRPGGGLESVPAHRVALSRYGNRLAGAVLGHGVTMATGMTRAYRRAVLPQILSPRDGKEFHLDVLSRALGAGLRIREVPATVAWREPGLRRRRFASGRVLVTTIARHLELLGRHAATGLVAGWPRS